MTLYLNGTTGISGVDGSAGTPAVQGTDTNTGISFPAADTIAFNEGGAEVGRFDSSGRLLVGTSSARSNFFNSGASSAGFQIEGSTDDTRRAAVIASGNDAYGAELILAKQKSGTIGGNTIVANNDSIGDIVFQGSDGSEFVQSARIEAFVDGTPGANDMPGRLVFSTTKDGQASPTQAFVINSTQDSNFTTSASSLNSTGWYGVSLNATVGAISISRTGSNVMAFFHTSNANGLAGTPVGTISITTTATAYNTSSDYRLKENIEPVSDGITRLQQLKPSRFNFIADPHKTVDGFLAHEAAEVVPEAITGEKDAVDDDGNPVYQGIDQSKLVPLLTAALQEAVARIEQLETAVATLQGS